MGAPRPHHHERGLGQALRPRRWNALHAHERGARGPVRPTRRRELRPDPARRQPGAVAVRREYDVLPDAARWRVGARDDGRLDHLASYSYSSMPTPTRRSCPNRPRLERAALSVAKSWLRRGPFDKKLTRASQT